MVLIYFLELPYFEINDSNRFEVEEALLWFENFIKEKFKEDIKKLNLKLIICMTFQEL